MGDGITISGDGKSTDFIVSNGDAGAPATLEGLTIADGDGVGASGAGATTTAAGGNGQDSAGGLWLFDGAVNLVDDAFNNDTATGGTGGASSGEHAAGSGGNAAGAVYIEAGATVTATDLTFSGDTANAGQPGSNAAGGGAGSAGSAYAISNTDFVDSGVWTVTTNADSGLGSLRAILAEAHTGDFIKFASSLDNSTITLQSSLTISNGVTIDGFGDKITISGADKSTDFIVANAGAGARATLEGLIIANGHGVGATGSAGNPGAPDGGAGGDAAGGLYLSSGAVDLYYDAFNDDSAVGGTGGAGSGASGAGGAGGNAAGAVFAETGATIVASHLTFDPDTGTGGQGGDGNPPGNTGTGFDISNSAEVTGANAACYCAGTRILTERGEVAVENLAVGHRVVTASGARRPITWIGHRRIDIGRHPDPAAVWPVRVRAGAFAEGLPHRDLWLSPGHNVVSEGALIPISALINGVSVAQIELDRIDYWHIELDEHDILIADGLPAESYLDCGNRTAFANGGAFIEAHPDFTPKHWAETCLPLVTDGPAVAATKARLLARLSERGRLVDQEAGAHIIVDGRRIEPIHLSERRLAFVLPAGGQEIALRSNVFVPAHTVAKSVDPRELGLCVGRLQIDGATLLLDDETFASGWHEAEFDERRFGHRWTTGHTPLTPGARIVVVDLADVGHYWRKYERCAAAMFA